MSFNTGDCDGGLAVHRRTGRLLFSERAACARLRSIEAAQMSTLYIVSGVLAAGLFVYLVLALLFPEKFS
jgi:K+-transporting ATPase KdpF subunit